MATNNGAVVARTQVTGGRKPASARHKRAKSRRDSRRISARARRESQQSWDQLRDHASGLAEEGQDKLHALENSLKRFVREQPLKSALICTSLALAAGAGVLVGRLWPRRDSQPTMR